MSDYFYENLDEHQFQDLCATLIAKTNPTAQCFPVGVRDGGRDIITRHASGQTVVYQVKFSRFPAEVDDRAKELIKSIKKEIPKVKRLAQRGAKFYYMLTNLRGTATLDSGQIDRVQAYMNKELPIPGMVWWRNDISSRINAASHVKWSFLPILSAEQFSGIVLERLLADNRHNLFRVLRAYMRTQFDTEQQLKFRQIEISTNIFDLFVDIPCRVTIHNDLASTTFTAFKSRGYWPGTFAVDNTAQALLAEDHPAFQATLTVIEGAPGQGKSTLVQYVAQRNRRMLLQDNPKSARAKLPIKVDLRDLADWYADSKVANPRGGTLEGYIADHIHHGSGGHEFTIEMLYETLEASPALIILDGLDEIQDISLRAEVIELIDGSTARLQEYGAKIIVTTRPPAFSGAPEFSPGRSAKISLTDLPEQKVYEYAGKWADAVQEDKDELRSVLERKIALPHISELTKNLMQVAILVTLISRLGESLPAKRFDLYNRYIEHFLDRESEKSPIVRDNRTELLNIHGYIAWKLQAESEVGIGTQRLSEEQLREEMERYLQREGNTETRLADLFQGTLQRVVFLVSRREGEYEFEVKPILEYFVAHYLYNNACYSRPGSVSSGNKHDILTALLQNRDWLNVLRFFAGQFTKAEVPAILDELENLASDPDGHPVHLRQVCSYLLADRVFMQNPRTGRSAVEFSLRENEYYELYGHSASAINLSSAGGGKEFLLDHCYTALSANIPPQAKVGAADVIRAHGGVMESRREDTLKILTSGVRRNIPLSTRIALELGLIGEFVARTNSPLKVAEVCPGIILQYRGSDIDTDLRLHALQSGWAIHAWQYARRMRDISQRGFDKLRHRVRRLVSLSLCRSFALRVC